MSFRAFFISSLIGIAGGTVLGDFIAVNTIVPERCASWPEDRGDLLHPGIGLGCRYRKWARVTLWPERAYRDRSTMSPAVNRANCLKALEALTLRQRARGRAEASGFLFMLDSGSDWRTPLEFWCGRRMPGLAPARSPKLLRLEVQP
jgi:hypothetical protein